MGLAGASVGSGLLVSTGAFSSAQSERKVNLEVSKDPDAFLGLEQRMDGERSRIGDGKLRIRIPGISESMNGEGLNPNAITEFPNSGFVVTNKGSQPVGIYAHQKSTTGPLVEVFRHDDSSRDAIDKENPHELDVGSELVVGLRIDTHGVEPREEPYEESLLITTDHKWKQA